ncbi:hypothetical protein M8J75_000475 [Diaphorina citri]|nr:hypothetical protein M8J75_000475 [Diaphorina citri]
MESNKHNRRTNFANSKQKTDELDHEELNENTFKYDADTATYEMCRESKSEEEKVHHITTFIVVEFGELSATSVTLVDQIR